VLPRKPANKSVSLKLPGKTGAGSPTATGSLPCTGITGVPVRRSCSADVAWADTFPEALARQQLPAHKRTQVGSRASAVELLGEKLASTAPAVVQKEASGRPPVPTRPSPGVNSSDRRRNLASAASPPSPGSKHNNSAADDDLDDTCSEVGRVFAPVVAAPLNSLPRGGRGIMVGRGAGFRGVGGGLSRGRGMQAARNIPPTVEGDLVALLVGGHEPARRPSSRPSSSPSISDVGEAFPGLPREAWPESGLLEDGEDDNGDSEVAELASQIHRDLLVRRLLDSGDTNTGEGGVTTSNTSQDDLTGNAETHPSSGSSWVPRTADARTVLEDTERTLKEAAARAEAKRRELGAFLEELRSRTFESSDLPEKASGSSSRLGGSGTPRQEQPELLVSLPVDFEDMVDLNAQLSTQRRTSTKHRRSSAESSGPAAPRSSIKRAAEAKDSDREETRLHIPSFLQKYFDEDKALEELPHKRLDKEETEAERVRLPEEEDELQRGLRQIAKLDGLLVRREASAQARLQAAKIDLEAARERLRHEAEKSQEEKIEFLRQLKDNGLLGGGSASVSSRRTSKCSTIEPYTANSGSASSRSLATVDGGELSTTSSRASPMASQHMEESSPVVWSGWTSTAATNAGEDVEAGEQSTSGIVDEHDHPATPTNVTDTDTFTFNLTSTTASCVNGIPQAQPSSDRKRPTSGLAPVAEEERGESNEAELMLEDTVADIIDDPYVEDHEAIDALRRIDEQLQRLVPEQEWEAKSICSFPSRSSAAGESAAGARSVWSRFSGDGPMPAIPMLCEQFEKRESELALVSIDNRLQEMQYAEAPGAPSNEEIRALLLQAAHETSVPDAETKVLALTGTAPLQLADALSDSNAMVLANETYSDSDSLRKAREILKRLEGGDRDWYEAFGEAQSSLCQLEVELKDLEERPRSGSSATREQATLPETELPMAAPFAKRLEELSVEVQSILERKGADEGILEKIRRELAGDSEAFGVAEDGELDGALATSEFDDGFISSMDVHSMRCDNEKPNLELLKALDIELPSSDGMWDNDELERVVTAMNAHYGDVLPAVTTIDVDQSQAIDEPEA